jgi:hypothetical protein
MGARLGSNNLRSALSGMLCESIAEGLPKMRLTTVEKLKASKQS